MNEICLNLPESASTSLSRRMSVDLSSGSNSRSSSFAVDDSDSFSFRDIGDVQRRGSDDTVVSSVSGQEAVEQAMSATFKTSNRSARTTSVDFGSIRQELASSNSADSGGSSTKSASISDLRPKVLEAPLFEHFLVVGVDPDFAKEHALKLFKEMALGAQKSLNTQKRGSSFLQRMGQSLGMNSRETDNDIGELPIHPKTSTLSRLFQRKSSANTAATTTESVNSWSSTSTSSDLLNRDADVLIRENASSAPPTPLRVKTASKTTSLPSTAVITDPNFLFRYPEEIDPPPSDLKFFCLPGNSTSHVHVTSTLPNSILFIFKFHTSQLEQC